MFHRQIIKASHLSIKPLPQDNQKTFLKAKTKQRQKEDRVKRDLQKTTKWTNTKLSVIYTREYRLRTVWRIKRELEANQLPLLY